MLKYTRDFYFLDLFGFEDFSPWFIIITALASIYTFPDFWYTKVQ